jgi:tRNA A-37 threonylcarbamoyl transferase component Bud32
MELPDSLGRYRLTRELGRGAMGVVYEGWDDDLHRQVAVKTVRTSQLLDPGLATEYSRRFILEAKNAGQLMHPHVVTVFDFGNEAGMDYLVMELIHGKELKAYLEAGYTFSVAEAVAIACQLLEALAYVHSKRIYHRDIKPANVMLETGTRRVRLTDFGVARFCSGKDMDEQQAGTMVGTPGYMSPEQINGVSAGIGTDLFATGVLLYQCLTLHKPFVGANALEIWQQTVNEEPPPMASYREGIPDALERAVRHALAKDPAARPASARAFSAELQDAIAGERFDAEKTRIVGDSAQRGGVSTGPVSGMDMGTAQAGRAGRERHVLIGRTLPAVGGAAIVLLLLLVFRNFFSTTSAPPHRTILAQTAAPRLASRPVSPAPPGPVPAPANAQGKMDHHVQDRQKVQEHDRPKNAVEQHKPKVDVEEPADATPARQSTAERAGPALPAPEPNQASAKAGAVLEADDEAVAIQEQQARYMKAAQLAESKGDQHGALVLYKHAYDAGSGGDATRPMRDVSGRAAQALSEIFGREGERMQQLTWSLNAKTMHAEVATGDKR